MPLGDILKQPQRMGEERDPRAQMAQSVLGMIVPSLGVAQGANEYLSGGGLAGLGMAAAGMIPAVPKTNDEMLELGASLASKIRRNAEENGMTLQEGVMEFLDGINASGHQLEERLLEAIEFSLGITR